MTQGKTKRTRLVSHILFIGSIIEWIKPSRFSTANIVVLWLTPTSPLSCQIPNNSMWHENTIRNLSSKTAFILINNLFNVKTQKNYGAPPPSHRAIEASKVILATSAGNQLLQPSKHQDCHETSKFCPPWKAPIRWTQRLTFKRFN